jgi:hypothetical protein
MRASVPDERFVMQVAAKPRSPWRTNPSSETLNSSSTLPIVFLQWWVYLMTRKRRSVICPASQSPVLSSWTSR